MLYNWLSFLLYILIIFSTIWWLWKSVMIKDSYITNMIISIKHKSLSLFFIFIFIIFLFYLNHFFNNNVKHEYYGIIFDAGSTGSRIHAFKFLSKRYGNWVFDSELFLHVKPGLSSYADDPKKGADSLISMLDRAKEYIPKQFWSNTPITLQATAGLRLLPTEKADSLLNSVRNLFQLYPFRYESNSVKIMDSDDEGLFSWATLNYLKKMLNNGKDTYGAIDLGGGSVQITYIPNEKETITDYPPTIDPIRKINLMGKEFTAFTKSYLGLGLMAARFKSLKNPNEPENLNKNLKSVCLPTNYHGTWKQQNEILNISAEPVALNRFSECQESIRNRILLYRDDIIVKYEFMQTKFYIMSYFYDRALQAGILGDNYNGETIVKPSDYLSAAKRFCEEPKPRKVFFCFDLIYIGTLLQEVFKFGPNFEVMVVKKIDNTEISWALGAMLSQLPYA